MKEENLRERTKKFSLSIIRIFTALPSTGEAQVIGKQMLRSATSVGAHYREGFRSRSKNEFIAKLEDGLQELEETGYWLELLRDAKIVSSDQITPLCQEVDELISIFVTIVKKTKASTS